MAARWVVVRVELQLCDGRGHLHGTCMFPFLNRDIPQFERPIQPSCEMRIVSLSDRDAKLVIESLAEILTTS